MILIVASVDVPIIPTTLRTVDRFVETASAADDTFILPPSHLTDPAEPRPATGLPKKGHSDVPDVFLFLPHHKPDP
jgi:hypothetical protein